MQEDKISKEEFADEMNRFKDETAKKIIEVLDEDKYYVPIEVLGLIGIIRVLINTFGDEKLLDTAVRYLTYEADTDFEDNIN